MCGNTCKDKQVRLIYLNRLKVQTKGKIQLSSLPGSGTIKLNVYNMKGLPQYFQEISTLISRLYSLLSENM